jgi:hypothetical protein
MVKTLMLSRLPMSNVQWSRLSGTNDTKVPRRNGWRHRSLFHVVRYEPKCPMTLQFSLARLWSQIPTHSSTLIAFLRGTGHE